MNTLDPRWWDGFAGGLGAFLLGFIVGALVMYVVLSVLRHRRNGAHA